MKPHKIKLVENDELHLHHLVITKMNQPTGHTQLLSIYWATAYP
jgi:hypothetical protein